MAGAVSKVTINVTNVPLAPIWKIDALSGRVAPQRVVAENSPVGTTLSPPLRVASPEGNPLRYAIRAGNDKSAFTVRSDGLQQAHHEAMECLGRMLWESQRAGLPPDGAAYLANVQRRATRD